MNQPTTEKQVDYGHDLDGEAICRRCGFDAAEWWHLERMKPRGEREEQPACCCDAHWSDPCKARGDKSHVG